MTKSAESESPTQIDAKKVVFPSREPYISYNRFEQAIVDILYGNKKFHTVPFNSLAAASDHEREVAAELTKWQQNTSAVIDTFRARQEWLNRLPTRMTDLIYPLADQVYPGNLDQDLETGRKSSDHLKGAFERPVYAGPDAGEEE